MHKENFIKIFTNQIKPGFRVVDFGAGKGEYSQIFAEKGALVTAVDPKLPELSDVRIRCVRTSIVDFISHDNGNYDCIFMRNILQFLDKEWVYEILFPWTEEHLTSGGVIAIKTFYKDPVPAFSHSFRSFYTVDDLTGHFITLAELYSQQDDYDGPDMGGVIRHFFVSEVIERKK